jgi:YHS domain-containing protein
MSKHVWCHGPSCHKFRTQDRIRGVKGSKVLRTRKVKTYEGNRGFYTYFCSNGCYNDFANKHAEQIIRIEPRHEPLETPIDIETETRQDWNGHDYTVKNIVDRQTQ